MTKFNILCTLFITYIIFSNAKFTRTVIEICDDSIPAIDVTMVKRINKVKTSWKAVVSERFKHATRAEVKRMVVS